jgi:LTXXQ motif family protein
MWKAVLAGTTALAIVGATLASAQTRPDRSDGTRRWRPTAEDMRAFADSRLAALHAGLTLTADQEKYWPAFEKAARALQKIRLDRVEARRAARDKDQGSRRDPVERLRQRAIRMSETGAALKDFADAMAPLYGSLSDSQKHRFAMLGRMIGPRGFWRGGRAMGGRHPGWRDRGAPPRRRDRDDNEEHRRGEALPPSGPEFAGMPMFGRMDMRDTY